MRGEEEVINRRMMTRDDELKQKGYYFLLCLRPAAVMDNLDNASLVPPPDSHFKNKTRRKFVRLIKALLFETSLANKIRKKAKKKQCPNGDSPSLKLDTYPVMAPPLNKKFGVLATPSNKINTAKVISGIPSMEISSSILSSSSCASSVASSSMRFPDSDLTTSNVIMEQKQKNEDEKLGKGINTGVCLIVVALLVLVIWGKLFAILCTSASLFFVPNWSKGKTLLFLMKSRLKSD